MILRTDVEGQSVQLFAGGLQNPRELAFDRDGELLVHDRDMEPDQGMPWYRPTRLYHVTAGAEFGWRSGWAKWPEYFVDNLPGILDTGRGSPAGAVFYHHTAFPARWRNALFLADRSQERILAIDLTSTGANVYRPQRGVRDGAVVRSHGSGCGARWQPVLQCRGHGQVRWPLSHHLSGQSCRADRRFGKGH